jgi:hypothetical protein
MQEQRGADAVPLAAGQDIRGWMPIAAISASSVS